MTTDAQREALRKGEEILGEHFEAYCLGVISEVETNVHDFDMTYEGGFWTCLGLTRAMQNRMDAKSATHE